MARLSYQKVRYRLVKEEGRLYELLDEALMEVREVEGITSRYTFAEIDRFYESVGYKFKNLTEYAKALEPKRHEIITELRVEVINEVCEGNAFKGKKFNDRVDNILSLRLVLESFKKYPAEAVFLAIIDPNTPMTELFTAFGIRRRTTRVNWEESKSYEQAYKQRRRQQPFQEDYFWERVAGNDQSSRPEPKQQTVRLSAEGWPTDELWAYRGEAALYNTTYETVLDITSSVTEDHLKTLYSKAIKVSHQDATGSTDQAERAKQVIAAYRVARKVLRFD